jgi:hypothetical protein
MADAVARVRISTGGRRVTLRKFLRRKSPPSRCDDAAAHPDHRHAGGHRRSTRSSGDAQQADGHFVGLRNFSFLFTRNILDGGEAPIICVVTAVVFKALIGSWSRTRHNIPVRGQRKWRGMLLVP